MGSRVVRFMEKPLQARGRISGGFFVFQRSLFEHLVDDPALIFEHEPLSALSRAGELTAYQHSGFWHPMDNSRDYHYLNELWNSGRAPWNVWEAPAARLAA
jgi:glucose-1-phosphate cytidylyltransferase